MNRFRFLSATFVTTLCVLLSTAVYATGPWYVSTSGDDANDCLTPTTPCATINAAIDNASLSDVVFVAAGTYTGDGTEVVRIVKGITLSGGWDETFITANSTSIIDGESQRRGMDISGGADAIIERFTIQNGSAFSGAGVNVNFSTLVLNDSVIRGNNSNSLGGAGVTIYGGTTTINNSTITNNNSVRSGGGLYAQSEALVSISDSKITNNQAGRGGGVAIAGFLTLLIDNTTISGNSSFTGGGGIDVFGSSTLTVKNSTVSDNGVVNGYGGGLSVDGWVVIENTTISGNQAISGAGIYNNSIRPVIVNYCTISNNTATGDGGGVKNNFGSSTWPITTMLHSTIIAGNNSGTGEECSGSPNTSLGFNLSSDYTCNLTELTDLPFTNPLLGLLKDNGGGTHTHALQEGSPAIDWGMQNCIDHNGGPLVTDQREEPRPVDGNNDGLIACDIGAFELQPYLVEIEIDIKPGSIANSINLKSKGIIPVAIITTSDFDATTVAPSSLRFGPSGALAKHNDVHIEDINRDGYLDVVGNFPVREAGIKCRDTSAVLRGETIDGRKIEGSDLITIVMCE